MPNLAKKIELLSDGGKARAEGYVDALLSAERETEEVRAAIQRGLDDIEAGRVIDDDEVWRQMEAEFGPARKRRAASR